jgi:poly(A) polymerase
MGRDRRNDRQSVAAAGMDTLAVATGWRRPGLGLIAAALDAKVDMTRLVGGAVRDSLAGLAVHDIDLATRFSPQEVMARLSKADIKCVPTGIAHGTVTAVLDSGPVEITTLRRDVSTDGRRATIAFSDDWREDAARRDFTINALYADLNSGTIEDFFGGREDLKQGVVRFIGDPLTRIAEDHLRILRFFRFHARFGKGAPEPAALAACSARSNDLMALSRERIADELLKLLRLPNPVDAVASMLAHAILKPVIPEIAVQSHLKLASLIERERRADVAPDPIRRLAALLPADLVAVRDVAARLKLSKLQRKRLDALAQRTPSDANAPMALAYWTSPQIASDRLLLGDGDLSLVTSKKPPLFPLSGKDVVARGIRPGPLVAAILKQVELSWVASNFPAGPKLVAILDQAVRTAPDKER